MHTTASKITMLRMILIPVFLIFLYLDMRYWALAVFIIASASDAVDGYIARHYNQVTNFGKFMDPLADKVLVITAMCYYIEAHQMAAWVVAIVIFREFAVSGLGMGSRVLSYIRLDLLDSDPSDYGLLRNRVLCEEQRCF